MNASSAERDPRTVVVTGAARGIGRAVVEVFLERGARVVALDRDEAGLIALEAAHPHSELLAHALDVARPAAWSSAPLRDDRVDLLVTAAGVCLTGPTAGFDPAQWRRTFEVNVDGVFLAAQTYHAALRRSPRPNLVVVGSAAGLRPGPGAVAYAASKAALVSLVKSLAVEWAATEPRVRVNLVSPGTVRTPMWSEQSWFASLVAEQGGEEAAFAALATHTPLQRVSEPREIVDAILWLASEGAPHVTAANLLIDGGWSGA